MSKAKEGPIRTPASWNLCLSSDLTDTLTGVPTLADSVFITYSFY